MKSKSLFARCLAAGLAAVLMLTQVVFPHRAEANFWLERSQASRRLRQEDVAARAGAGEESARQRTLFASLAGLPLSTGAGAALDARISNGLDAAVPGLGRQAPAGETANKLMTALSARGTLRDIKGSVDFRSRPAAIVVLLQDIHHHPEAQNSLAEILRGILDVAPEAVVGLEGGAGRLDVAPFRLRSAKANATAAEFLKNAGLIGGAESVLLTAPRSVQAWGAEDPDLYLANVAAVRKAAPRRAASRLRLGSARRALQEAKARIYSPALADYDRRRSDHEAGRATLGGYVEYLAGVRSLPAPLADSALGRFLDTLRQEKALDMAAAKADRAALLEKLVVRLDRGTLDELLRASLAYRAGTLSTGVYYDYLRRSTARAGLPLDRFPRFAGYVRYVLSADAIRPEALWRELAEREAAVGRALCANGDQRALLEADGDLALVEKVVALSLTTDEWRRYQERRPRLRGLPASIRNWGGGDVSEEWKTDLSIFERFYVLAEERNAAMVERLWRVLPQSDPERVPVAVLVAGGFHAEGVGRLLSGRGAVSLVATPKLSGSVEGVPGPFELFAGEKAPLEEIFESPRITLAETLAVAGTIGQSARAAAARALGPLAGALTEAVEGAEAAAESPDGVRLERSPDGRGGIAAVRTARHTMYLSMAPSGETVPAIDKKLRGARAVLDRVAAGGHDFSVHTRRLSAAQRFAGWAARSARRVWPALARAGARGAKVLLIATVVFAATGLLFPAESLAYEFVRQGTEVVFTPTAGEHLWGAAKELLRLSGVEHATGGQIWDVVRRIGEANGLTDLDRIFAGQSYRVPGDLLPPIAPESTVLNPAAPSAAPVVSPTGPSIVSGDAVPASAARGGVWIAMSEALSRLTPAQWGVYGFLGFSYWWVLRSGRGSAAPSRMISPAAPRVSWTTALWETFRTPWLLYGLGAWAAVRFVPDFGPVAWVTAQLALAGFDTFLKMLSVIVVFFAFRFGYALWRQTTAEPPDPRDPALVAWRDLLARPEPWSALETNAAVDSARAALRNHRFMEPGMDASQNATAYHVLARQAQETAERIRSLLSARPEMREESRRELMAKALWFERAAHYAVRARKLTVGSVINVEHIRLKYGGTQQFREVLWGLVRSPAGEGAALFRDPRAVDRLRSSLKELAARYIARPLFGMNQRLAQEERKFDGRARALTALGNKLEPGLYDRPADLSAEWRQRLFREDLTDKAKPGLPGVWDGRNLLSPVLALLFAGVYALYVMQHGTLGLPVVIAAALIGSLGVMASLHRFFIAKGFWDPAYHTESQALRSLAERLDTHWGVDWRERVRDFERRAVENDWAKSMKARWGEVEAAVPSVDVLVLVAANPEQRRFYEAWRNAAESDPSLWRVDTPILVLTQERPGSGNALAEAYAAVRARWPELIVDCPRLAARGAEGLRVASLHSDGAGVGPLETVIPGPENAFGPGARVFDLQLANAVRAAQDLKKRGRGGHAFFNVDRPFIGPIEGRDGIHLLSAWKSRDEVSKNDWGFLSVDAAGRVGRLIGEAGYDRAGKHLRESDPLKRYAAGAEFVQAFSGSGVVAFGQGFSEQAHADVLEDIVRLGRERPSAPAVDLLDDVLIPWSLGAKKAYSYLAARGDLSADASESRLTFFRALFNRYERRLSEPPPLESHAAPRGGSQFLPGAAAGRWENWTPSDDAVDNTERGRADWLDDWASDGGRWRRWLLRRWSPAAAAVAGSGVAFRVLAGAPPTRLEQEMYPLIARVADLKAGLWTALGASILSVNAWAYERRQVDPSGWAFMAGWLDGPMMAMGTIALLAVTVYRRAASGPMRARFLGALAVFGAALAFAPGAHGAESAVAARWEGWNIPVLLGGLVPWFVHRPGRKSAGDRTTLKRGRGVAILDAPLEGTVSAARWRLEREAAALESRGASGTAALWRSLLDEPATVVPGLERPRGQSGSAAVALIVQLAAALETRERGYRPTAETLQAARIWGEAGGPLLEMNRLLEPILPTRLRGRAVRPLFLAWMDGVSTIGGRSWPVVRTRTGEREGLGSGGDRRALQAPRRSRAAETARRLARLPASVLSHPWSPAVLTVVTLPVLFGANLLGLLAAFQLIGWQAPGAAAVIGFVVAVAGALAEHKLLSDLRREWSVSDSPGRDAEPPPPSPSAPAVDVTAEALSDRPASVERLLGLLTAVRRGGDAAAERALVRSLLALVAQGPLRNDLSEGFDALKSRRWLRAGMRERAAEIRRGDAPPVERYVNEHVSARLALQLARVAVTAEEGRSPDVELRQASYLAGLAGMPRGEADRLIASVSRAVGASAPSERSMVWEQGQTLNRQSADASGRPADHVPSALVTALRVTELLQDFGSSPESRALVAGQIESRSGRSARRPDILIVNGAWLSQTRGAWNEARVKRSLRKALRDDRGQLSPEVARYLSAARVMIVSEDTFAPEAVIAFDAGARRRRGKTLDLFTADLEAVSFDPRREDAPYRVLLMQWLGGRLTVVDVGEATRRALRTARVLATSA